MDNNENFSIDDILSEVKRRREENEAATEATQPEHNEPEVKVQDKDFSISEEKKEQDSAKGELTMQDTAQKEDAPEESDAYDEESDAVPEEAKPSSTDVADTDNTESEEGAEEGMVDLLTLATQEIEPEEENEMSKAKKKLNPKIKAVIIILVVLIIGAGVFAAVYINNMLNKVTDDTKADNYQMDIYYDGMDFLQEDFPMIDEMPAYEINGYKDYLKQWYEHGDPVSSTHVLNVLLIGEDTREAQISDTSRADSAIIASINIDTGEIHLTSILRDLYVYYEVNGQGYYGKINEAASMGGMRCYIKTIERYYKIAINNYAVVNFASFPKIIDALNGVNIKITTAEIYEINSHPSRYGGVTIDQNFEGSEGTMTLNGKQALAYCRIRKIDSDGARADRQKNVLKALLKKMQKAGKLDTVKVVNQLSQYVYTGYSKKDLIAIGNTAIKDGWLDYKLKSRNVPRVENCKGGQTFSVAPKNWIWLADIPKDAYQLQMEIYGKSNIKLNDNRADYIALGR